MTETTDAPSFPDGRPSGFSRLGRFLVSPLRRLLGPAEDPEVRRARGLSDAELADALEREVHAVHNADDEVWIDGFALVREAARRLRAQADVEEGVPSPP